jgi:hypothetical protein
MTESIKENRCSRLRPLCTGTLGLSLRHVALVVLLLGLDGRCKLPLRCFCTALQFTYRVRVRYCPGVKYHLYPFHLLPHNYYNRCCVILCNIPRKGGPRYMLVDPNKPNGDNGGNGDGDGDGDGDE